jgi:putative thioredoxin
MADVTDATFETEVVERSRTVPVVVDLWAEWCSPCKTLGPILETVIAETDGAVELAKVDVDANPAVSQAFQVQSIPAVYALVDAKVVDGFMGAQPEAQVREFVQRLVDGSGGAEPSEVDLLVAAGDEASLRQALELEPGNEAAVLALAELLAGQGSGEEALELLERIPETADVRRVAALARMGGEIGSQADIEAELAGLLEQVKADDDARERFVDLLELVADEADRTAWRRKLSARLF